MELRKTSTLLGCGCAAIITVFMLCVVAVTWFGYRSGKEMERLALDPEAAGERVREVVAYRSLPPGYRPFGAIGVPLVFQVALFFAPEEAVTAAVSRGEDPAAVLEAGFLFIKVRDWLGRGSRTEEWLRTGEGDDLAIEQDRLAFDPEEVVARGELDAGGARALWVARRGDIEIHGEHLGGGPQILVDGEPVVEVDYDDDGGDRPTAGGPRPALLTVISLECEDQRWERIAVWFALDPAPGVPAAEVDWSGTPADPEAIADFLGRLELCG